MIIALGEWFMLAISTVIPGGGVPFETDGDARRKC